MDDLEVPSECPDHFDAGIDTTADTLMSLFWAVLLPKNKDVQARLTDAITAPPETWALTKRELSAAAADKLPYLNAVIKETLRLYAPFKGLRQSLAASCMEIRSLTATLSPPERPCQCRLIRFIVTLKSPLNFWSRRVETGLMARVGCSSEIPVKEGGP